MKFRAEGIELERVLVGIDSNGMTYLYLKRLFLIDFLGHGSWERMIFTISKIFRAGNFVNSSSGYIFLISRNLLI